MKTDPRDLSPALAYTVPQASDRSNIPETKLWAAIKDGRLPSFREGRSRRVSEWALKDYIEALESVETELRAHARDAGHHGHGSLDDMRVDERSEDFRRRRGA